ncbi:BlaI/MecI/CopY family transcriptional regulator [Paenibacillus sp. 1011MAR3C5]|uniref:BlaI/MecI/CopY family transcriptional regulator n=1 Tax=Paenibacillus sp. 1011MAR3C5 TaxID=1675787 RepID=UPI000E6BF278|nr:BlaI/MecI/CopY family transcriptional regulator [Paenibacillus sp. 1011MAR3C5]RJE88399.1 BlaI/MecI/CopY family transcriptional regulator [Paenibacillus sp. 1011MAR3C5]
MKIKRLNVDEEGLNRFFGPLEAKIMDILWSTEGMKIKEVQTILNQESPISVNAVMTVMNRLVYKGHLAKVQTGTGRNQAAQFSAVLPKEQFLSEQTKAVSQGLIQEYGSLVVSHMIDALDDVDQETISKLERKLSELKRGKKNEPFR